MAAAVAAAPAVGVGEAVASRASSSSCSGAQARCRRACGSARTVIAAVSPQPWGWRGRRRKPLLLLAAAPAPAAAAAAPAPAVAAAAPAPAVAAAPPRPSAGEGGGPGAAEGGAGASVGPGSGQPPSPQPSVPVPPYPAAALSAIPQGGAQIAVVVPYRNQLPLQDRAVQLQRFLPYMEAFLSSIPGSKGAVIIVEQSDDRRKFNRGQLLNVGYRLAKEALPGLTSFVTHDVDLLPSMDMRPVYAKPPPEGHAVHLASVWQKYTYGTFIGGVLAFSPKDFERVNGYPNDYWGWGLEDDQLALRMSQCSVRTLRVRSGSYNDLDPMNMKGILDRGQREEVKQHLPWYNAEMFRKGQLFLDKDWDKNGLQDLAYSVISSTVNGLVHHCKVHLGPLPSGLAPAPQKK